MTFPKKDKKHGKRRTWWLSWLEKQTTLGGVPARKPKGAKRGRTSRGPLGRSRLGEDMRLYNHNLRTRCHRRVSPPLSFPDVEPAQRQRGAGKLRAGRRQQRDEAALRLAGEDKRKAETRRKVGAEKTREQKKSTAAKKRKTPRRTYPQLALTGATPLQAFGAELILPGNNDIFLQEPALVAPHRHEHDPTDLSKENPHRITHSYPPTPDRPNHNKIAQMREQKQKIVVGVPLARGPVTLVAA